MQALNFEGNKKRKKFKLHYLSKTDISLTNH